MSSARKLVSDINFLGKMVYMEKSVDVYRFEVERLNMKLAYLQLLNMPVDRLLEFLKIDLSKSIPGIGRLCCPKCGLTPNDGALVVIHKDFTRDSPLLRKVRARDGNDINAMTTDYYVCECGCVYHFFSGHKKVIRREPPPQTPRPS